MPSRTLTSQEKGRYSDFFGPSLDLEPVVITRGHPLSFHAPKALGNTVHLRAPDGHFEGLGLELSPKGEAVLVHELVHCWQYQNGGLAYIPGSLLAQSVALLRGRGRNAAYNWKEAMAAGRPWAAWNPEQQARAVEDLWAATRRAAAGMAKKGDAARMMELSPALAELRAGRGGAAFFRRE